MKSLVTGGAGFIGSNLVDYLVSKGHKVIVLDNFCTGKKRNLSHHKKKNVKIVKIDISTNKKLNKYFKNVNYVFHLAGLANVEESLKKPNKFFKSNVTGTYNIILASKKAKIKKFIFTASASCYGVPNKLPTSETDKINILHPYASTKWQAEKLIFSWVKKYNFPANSLRLFNVYGPRLNLTGAYKAVFGIFLSQKLKKKSLTITGNGDQTRDFVHIKDLVRALYMASKSKKVGQIYNVGSGKETKINKIAKLFGGKKIYVPKRRKDIYRSRADIKKIKSHLNWSPKVMIEKGTRDFLNFYKIKSKKNFY